MTRPFGLHIRNVAVTLVTLLALASATPGAASAFETHGGRDGFSYQIIWPDEPGSVDMSMGPDFWHADGPGFWFQLDDRRYRVRDAAVMKRTEVLTRSMREIGRQQSALGDIQSRIGDQESKLGDQESTLGDEQGRLAERLAAIQLRDGHEVERAAIERRMDEIGRQMDALGERMEPLARRLEELGHRQEALGERQQRASEVAHDALFKLAEESVRKGIAERVH